MLVLIVSGYLIVTLSAVMISIYNIRNDPLNDL